MKRITPFLFVLAVSFGLSAQPVDREARGPRREAASRHVILTPAGPLMPAERAKLRASGIHLLRPLTNGRFVASMRTGALLDERLARIEEFSADAKIHPSARRELASGSAWADLNLIFHEDVTIDEAREAVLEAGGAMVEPLQTRLLPGQRLEVRIAPWQAGALVADDRVFGLVGPRRFRVETDNQDTAEMIHVTELQTAPYGLTGAGVTVSLFEIGESQSSHVEFGGRLTTIPAGCSGPNSQHATHVAGTIGAAGVNAQAKGMAPAATIFQLCVRGGGNWLTDKDQQLASRDVVADNNSWGFVLGWDSEDGNIVWTGNEEYYGAYDLITTAPIDRIANERNILFVHSAGNDGSPPSFPDAFKTHLHTDALGDPVTTAKWCISENGSGTDCPTTCNGGCETAMHAALTPYDTLGLTASAKNVIAVGNVSTTGSLVGSSSRGPAKDGRVKPDVVARGFNVLSSVPTSVYGRLTGTSMAAPAVTGVAALLTEQWRKTFLRDPLPGELKALIIAGTEDAGNAGPDYAYGFGLVNAKQSADLLIADEGTGQRIRTLTMDQGQQNETTLSLTETRNLRVVLSWPDPDIAYLGGDDIAAKALVNDLDLRVIGPNGETHHPWVLDRTEPAVAATRGVNSVDNTEMLEIENAAPGNYRVIVTGTSVPDGPQKAHLIATAKLSKPCVDPYELGDVAEAAYGNLTSGQSINSALCTAADVDYFKFTATRTGAVAIDVTTGDTALVITLTGTGIDTSVIVPAHSSQTVAATAGVVPNAVVVKVEASGTVGAESAYSLTAHFGEQHGRKRRGARK